MTINSPNRQQITTANPKLLALIAVYSDMTDGLDHIEPTTGDYLEVAHEELYQAVVQHEFGDIAQMERAEAALYLAGNAGFYAPAIMETLQAKLDSLKWQYGDEFPYAELWAELTILHNLPPLVIRVLEQMLKMAELI